MKMRKMVALLMSVLMLCCIIPFSVAADSTSATITFDDTIKPVEFDDSHQVWVENGITVTNNKGSSTSNVADYAAPARFYKNSNLIVEYPGMTQIVFNCNNASYATALAGAIADAAVDGKTVTVSLNGGDSFTCTLTAGQVRMDSITVYSGDAPAIPDPPVDPDVPDEDPEADTELSIAEAIALGLSKEHNTYTADKYYVTGVITEVYNTQYGNMYITDGNGNTLTIYGTYSADGADRYDAMDVKPVAGDTVTIYGIVGQYNGSAQIKNGWIVEHVAGDGETPDVPVNPPVDPDASAATVVTNPVAGVAYKLGLDQTEKGSVYYFTGEMSGYYGATDTDLSKAVDMYLETADGGYKLYFNDANGAKKYIKLEQSGTHYNFTFGAEGSVFTLDAEKNALCAPCGDQICYMGTYGTYVTVGTLTTEKLQDTDYIARLYSVGGVDPDVPTDDTLTIEEAIALGLSMEHNTFTEQKYYVTGVITEVYNEMYGNMRLTDDAGNILTIYGTYSADGSTRYDALEVKPVAGDTVTIYGIVGQYSGSAQIKNGWIVEHIPGEGEEPPSSDVDYPSGYNAYIDFTNQANRVSYSSEQQVWAQEGITVTNDKGASTSNVGDYSDPARFYKSSTVTIEYPGMTEIIIECFGLEDKYISGWIDSVNDANVIYAEESAQLVHLMFAEPVDSFTWETLAAQSRANYIFVYAEESDVPVEPDGSIVVSTTEGKVGDTVSVAVTLPDNPGIVSAKVKVYFDTAVLKLVSYEAGNFSAGGYSWGQLDEEYFIINWCDATHPDSTADLLATLTFEVLEGAPEGFTAITLEFSCEDDMFNAADETIYFEAVDGGVEIVTVTVNYGDTNGDGRINNRDLGLLQQHVNEWDVDIDLAAADVNGDGRVNNRDLGLLQQYVNEWDVELG